MRKRRVKVVRPPSMRSIDSAKFYQLSPRYRYIIQLRLGLEGERKHTFEEIAMKIGVKRQRAWELYRRALKRVKR